MSGKSKVSLAQVALHSGVSTTTASMVLSNRWREFRIAPATRDTVLAAAQELGYTTKRSPRPRSSQLWAIFAPSDFDLGPTSEFYRGVHGWLREQDLGIEVVVFPFERGALRDKVSWLSPSFAAGAIMLGLGEDDVAFLERERIEIPLVLVNRVAKNWPSVMTDDYTVGDLVAEHFARRGLKHVAMIIPTVSARSQSLRIVGFEDHARRFTRAEQGEIPQAFGTNDITGGHAAIAKLLPALERSTGIFVLNDGMVGGVMNGLLDAGWSVPGDVEVVSYGNGSVNALLRPSVTSVVTPLTEMSRDAARALSVATEPDGLPGTPTSLFDVTLAYRDSSPAPDA